ncbi:MAG: NUMOD1 domain-containing DNA-binding protein, partial [Peptostreptococcaceae bacterium]
ISKKKNIGDEKKYIEIDIEKEGKIEQAKGIKKEDEVIEEVVKNQSEIEEEKKLEEFLRDNNEYIKEIKIKRAKGIKSIDLYNEETLEFSSYKECSKKLKIPMSYIKENLKYGYTDYLGDAINYLKEELGEDIKEADEYLNSNKTPIELFNNLSDKIFRTKMSEEKRDEILSNEKIEPVKMHYKFECIDKEYDDYFKIYGAIIKRGGSKKIELLNTKGEVIEVFRSIDSCAQYLNKDKGEIVEKLKCGDSKVGRYEIRYSLRRI